MAKMAESPIEITEPLIHEEKEEVKSKRREWDDIEERKSLMQRAIGQTFKSTAHLANLLPTGTVLTFQVLCPLFSNSGHCDAASRLLTEILLLLCGLSCFLVSFTDSFKGPNGNIYYGVATPRGLWTFDYVGGGVPIDREKYRLRFIDFGHAIMSVMVFAAVALLDHNVVNCLYPSAKGETKEVLDVLPVGIGAFTSLLFVAFPSTRHGVGFPVTADH